MAPPGSTHIHQSSELDEAVRAGVITSDGANALRNFVAQRSETPLVDEERFASAGMGEVLTTVGIVLTLGSATIFAMGAGPLGTAVTAPAAWLLAEYFTRRRRMMLPSFVLFAFFVVSWTMLCFAAALFIPSGSDVPHQVMPGVQSITPLRELVTAMGATLAAAVFWLRFRLPIAYAVSAIAAVNVGIHVLRILIPGASADFVSVILLFPGFGLFALAMWWDMSDIYRQTLRSDVAFWLHAAAGYQIAGTSFRLIAGTARSASGWDRLYAFAPGQLDTATALTAIALFAAFCVIALAIDRRSIMLSSLAMLLTATTQLADTGGWVAAAFPLGLMLLFVSAYWTRLRATVLEWLPATLAAQLPRTDLIILKARPVR